MRHFDGIARDLFSGDNINRNDGIQRDYYRFMVVEVEEKSGKDLTDYAVKANLSTIDWNSLRNDGNDIRIIQENKELNRVLENFSKANKTGDVWFKVSVNAYSKKKFLMLYGNQSADIPPSDPDKLYLFYDDFEGITELDPNKWYFDTDYVISDGVLRVLLSDDNRAIKTKNSWTGNLLAHFRWRYWVSSGFSWFGTGFSEDLNFRRAGTDDNALYVAVSGANYRNRETLHTIKGGTSTLLDLGLLQNIWKEYKLIRLDGKAEVIDVIGDYDGSVTTNVPTVALRFGIDIKYAEDWNRLDWVKIRKYTSPEPSVSLRWT